MALGHYSIMPLSGRMPDARHYPDRAPRSRQECPIPPPENRELGIGVDCYS
jgi:hypothetical protein